MHRHTTMTAARIVNSQRDRCTYSKSEVFTYSKHTKYTQAGCPVPITKTLLTPVTYQLNSQ